MRCRPHANRVDPKTVVECVDPDLLLYICMYELPRRYRTNRPERVSALAVHEWVMQMKGTYLDAEDDDGLAQVKKLSCDLGGLHGVREVQQLFIKLRKLRKLHRLKTKQRQIIIWLAYNIKPSNVRKKVQGILKQDTAGQARRQEAQAFS